MPWLTGLGMAETGTKPLLMGIVNVTPDSFSDGGEFFSIDVAVKHAVKMAEQGADILDVGGESTRPGAGRVTAADQIDRVIPVIEGIRELLPDIPISIDTTLAEVASAAIAAGAGMLNDVTAGLDDEAMLPLAASSGLPVILMHMQGEPATMQDNPHYDEVVGEILEHLLARAQAAEEQGVTRGNIIIDPGIGFGKTRQNNLDLIANLDRFVQSPYRVMLGASRKRFMGSICKIDKYSELVGATCATTTLGTMAGVHIMRVHDIRENRQALDVAWAIRSSIAG